MATILEMRSRLDLLASQMQAITGGAMKESEPDLIELNKEQMLSGIRADGEEIGQYKSISYALEKNKLNPKAGFGAVDLRLTGQFQSEMLLQVWGENYSIISDDPKTGKLADQYGEEIFGLTVENKTVANEIIVPSIIQQSKSILEL